MIDGGNYLEVSKVVDCRPNFPATNCQEVDKLRVMVQAQSALIESLKWANAQKDLLIYDAAMIIADLRRQLGRE